MDKIKAVILEHIANNAIFMKMTLYNVLELILTMTHSHVFLKISISFQLKGNFRGGLYELGHLGGSSFHLCQWLVLIS